MDWTRELFPHGALQTRRFYRLDLWIVPALCSGSAPRRNLNTGGVPNQTQLFCLNFFYIMLMSPHVKEVSVSQFISLHIMIFKVLSQLEILSLFTFRIFEFCHNLSFWGETLGL